MKDNELWKDIKGYEGIYKISSLGTIKRITTNKEKIRIPFKTHNGYLRLTLHKDGIRKRYMVHRLVAETFIPNLHVDRIFVNHKNHNRTDNRTNNLEWVTHQMNMIHAHLYSIGEVIDFTINHIFDELQVKRPDSITRLAIETSLYQINQ